MPITNVLLIDDEERFLITTRTLLQNRDCNVFTAADGWKGLGILTEKQIDVVVLDVKMPGIDGIEVLRHIRSEFPLVEVVMLTGHATMESVISGLKMGAFDYLTKPCDIEVLKQKIKAADETRSAMLAKIQNARLDRTTSGQMDVFVDNRT